jgi:hypothetical protein
MVVGMSLVVGDLVEVGATLEVLKMLRIGVLLVYAVSSNFVELGCSVNPGSL